MKEKNLLMAFYWCLSPCLSSRDRTPTFSAVSRLAGLITIPGGAGGTIIGGYLVTWFKLSARGIMRTSALCNTLVIFLTLMFFITCQGVQFPGVNVAYDNRSVKGEWIVLISKRKDWSAWNVDMLQQETGYQLHLKRVRPVFHCPIIRKCRGSRINWIWFTPIILAGTFRYHWPTVEPNFSVTENISPIVRPSLTCQTTADHLRFYLSPTQVLSLDRFSTRSFDSSGNGMPAL